MASMSPATSVTPEPQPSLSMPASPDGSISEELRSRLEKVKHDRLVLKAGAAGVGSSSSEVRAYIYKRAILTITLIGGAGLLQTCDAGECQASRGGHATK